MAQETSEFYNTKKYRCLVYNLRQTDDIYLLSCGVEQVMADKVYETDSREGYHLHVILSGKGRLEAGGKSYSLHFGQMFITKPGEWVRYAPDPEDPWSYCWMSFDGRNAAGYCESCGFTPGVYTLECFEDVQAFYDLVLQVMENTELTIANDVYRLGLLLQFISMAIRSNYKSSSNSRHAYEYGREAYVDHALATIHANYATINVADIAREIGIHRSYLTNIFKDKLGVSPQKYLLQYKMNMAARLLKETNFSIQMIATRVGYDNPLTFSKMFKSVYGVSPRYYRSKNENQMEEQL